MIVIDIEQSKINELVEELNFLVFTNGNKDRIEEIREILNIED